MPGRLRARRSRAPAGSRTSSASRPRPARAPAPAPTATCRWRPAPATSRGSRRSPTSRRGRASAAPRPSWWRSASTPRAATRRARCEVTAAGFRAAGRALGALGLPTVVVQEGGYDLEAIGGLVRETLARNRGRTRRLTRARAILTHGLRPAGAAPAARQGPGRRTLRPAARCRRHGRRRRPLSRPFQPRVPADVRRVAPWLPADPEAGARGRAPANTDRSVAEVCFSVGLRASARSRRASGEPMGARPAPTGRRSACLAARLGSHLRARPTCVREQHVWRSSASALLASAASFRSIEEESDDQIANTQLWVHDQDEALAFYTEKLGFEVRSDATLPELGDFRWLTVGPRPARRRHRADGHPRSAGDGRGGCRPVRSLMAMGFAGGLPHHGRLPGLLRGAQGPRRRVHRGARGAAVRNRLRVPRPLRQQLPADPGAGAGHHLGRRPPRPLSKTAGAPGGLGGSSSHPPPHSPNRGSAPQIAREGEISGSVGAAAFPDGDDPTVRLERHPLAPSKPPKLVVCLPSRRSSCRATRWGCSGRARSRHRRPRRRRPR